jgi:hypothetical protein
MYFSEPFTRMGAWIDMLLIANHKEGYFFVRGNKVTVSRGQIGMSQENFAKRWKWSRGKVSRFILSLENDGQIVQHKSNVTTLISICNYNQYQTDGTTDDTASNTTDGHQTVQQTDINNNDNNLNNENTDNKGKEKSKRFVPPTIDEIKIYCLERKNKVDPEKFFNFYQSKGWLVGRNKMKDWKASIHTWEKSDKSGPYIHPAAAYKQDNSEIDLRF